MRHTKAPCRVAWTWHNSDSCSSLSVAGSKNDFLAQQNWISQASNEQSFKNKHAHKHMPFCVVYLKADCQFITQKRKYNCYTCQNIYNIVTRTYSLASQCKRKSSRNQKFVYKDEIEVKEVAFIGKKCSQWKICCLHIKQRASSLIFFKEPL